MRHCRMCGKLVYSSEDDVSFNGSLTSRSCRKKYMTVRCEAIVWYICCVQYRLILVEGERRGVRWYLPEDVCYTYAVCLYPCGEHAVFRRMCGLAPSTHTIPVGPARLSGLQAHDM